MDLELVRKQYDFELEQRNSLSSSANIPTVSITIIGGVLSTILIGFKYSNSLESNIFLAFIGLSVLAMLSTVYYILRSLIGYTYEKLPSLNKMLAHIEELKHWYLKHGDNVIDAEINAKKDFDIFIIKSLSEASDYNSTNNIKRGSFLHGANVMTAIAFICLVLSAPIYLYQKTSDNNPVYQVKIVETEISELKGIFMSISDNDSTTIIPTGTVPKAPADNSPKPAAAPTNESKPQGPANERFKGNADVGKIEIKNSGSSPTDGS